MSSSVTTLSDYKYIYIYIYIYIIFILIYCKSIFDSISKLRENYRESKRECEVANVHFH